MSKNQYDLDKISADFGKILYEFQLLEYEKNLIGINQKLFNFKPSYIAPAYHLNRFDEVTIEFFKKDLPESLQKGVIDENSVNLLTVKLHLEFNIVLYSLKMSLDRIVFFMSKYYKGISPKNTFGRIRDDGKPKSMMAEVVRLKDSDKIMSLIFNNYNKWINKAVKPRDTITHYENLSLSFMETNEFNFTPVFSHREEGIDSFGRTELIFYIDNWYLFINEFFQLLLTEKIKN